MKIRWIESKVLFFIKITFVALIIMTSSCKKENTKNGQLPDNNIPSTVSLLNKDYVPSQIISISLDRPWAVPPKKIVVGDNQIDCFQVDSLLIAFCPNLSPGKYDLEVTNYLKSSINIYPVRKFNSNEIYDSLILVLNKKQNNIKGEYSTQFNYWKSETESYWTKLDDNQKEDAARIIVANNLLDTNQFPIFNPSELDSLKGRNYRVTDVDKYAKKFILDWTMGMVSLRKQIAITTAVLMASIEAVKLSGGNVIVAGSAIVANGITFGLLISKVSEQNGILDQYLDKTIRAFEFISAEGQMSTSIDLFNKKSKIIAPTIKFDNITENERNNPKLGWFFNGYSVVYKSLKNVNNVLTEVKKFAFSKSEDVLWSEKLNSNKYNNTFAIPGKNIQITNVSNNKIKLTPTSDAQGRFMVIAESELLEEINFTFTIKYIGSKMDADNVVKVVDAVFKPQIIIGNWMCYNPSDLNTKDIITWDCKGVKYQEITEVLCQSYTFKITADSVYSKTSSQVQVYSNNRPADCGGKFSTSWLSNSGLDYIITNTSNSSLDLYCIYNIPNRNWKMNYQIINKDEIHITLNDPQNNITSSLMKLRRQ